MTIELKKKTYKVYYKCYGHCLGCQPVGLVELCECKTIKKVNRTITHNTNKWKKHFNKMYPDYEVIISKIDNGVKIEALKDKIYVIITYNECFSLDKPFFEYIWKPIANLLPSNHNPTIYR